MTKRNNKKNTNIAIAKGKEKSQKLKAKLKARDTNLKNGERHEMLAVRDADLKKRAKHKLKVTYAAVSVFFICYISLTPANHYIHQVDVLRNKDNFFKEFMDFSIE